MSLMTDKQATPNLLPRTKSSGSVFDEIGYKESSLRGMRFGLNDDMFNSSSNYCRS